MLKIVPFEIDHFFQVDGRELKATREEHSWLAIAYYTGSSYWKPDEGSFGRSAFTVLDDDRVIGCFGVMVVQRNIGEIWVHISEELARHRFWFHKNTIRLFRKFTEESGIQQIDTTIDNNKMRSLEWVKRFGFTIDEPCTRFRWKRGDQCHQQL